MSFFDTFLRFNYSRDLHEHLKGMSVDCEGYTSQSIYQLMSLIMLILSTVCILNYYYGIFNRPSFSRLKTWGTNVFLISSTTAFLAYTFAAADLAPAQHCSYLYFFRTDCILFGMTAFIYNVFYCLLLSSSIKWMSVNNKKVPF
jgi:hypothetical protein